MGAPASGEVDRLRRLALERQAEGRFEAAYALLRGRAMLTPRDPAAWVDIALCLSAARMSEDALKAWDAALTLAPQDPALCCGKAGLLQGLGRSQEARALLSDAERVAPGDPQVRFGLARLAIEAGDWDEAARLAEALQAPASLRPELQWLATRIALGRGDLADAEARARRLAADPALAPEPRADALLLRAAALDRLGRAAEAFAAAAAGKTLQRRLFAARARGREGYVERLARLNDWFAKAKAGDWAARHEPGPASGGPRVHAFILGFPRSGTTLLEQALAGHPEVVALEEPPTLAAPAAELLSSSEGLARLASLSASQTASWRARYFAEVRSLGADASGRVLVDKAPAETSSLPLIAKLFPDARILFALRDPRDVVLSCFMSSFEMNALTYAFTDLAETAAAYAACMAFAETCRGLLPLNLMEIRHEALVQDFAAVVGAAARFLDIEPHPAMLDVAATAAARTVRTPSASLVRGGLTAARLGRWRGYADQLEPVLAVLEPWVRRLGYG
ncbi:MAG TPA: sulfotransferase [Caulobacteraceae bacterium]|nr:sulfotransferase [Caulobacteraceae bacterium]